MYILVDIVKKFVSLPPPQKKYCIRPWLVEYQAEQEENWNLHRQPEMFNDRLVIATSFEVFIKSRRRLKTTFLWPHKAP